jgi:hypothetical protein
LVHIARYPLASQGYETAIIAVVVTTVLVAANFLFFSKKSAPVGLDPKKEIEFEMIEREDLSHDSRR